MAMAMPTIHIHPELPVLPTGTPTRITPKASTLEIALWHWIKGNTWAEKSVS